MNQRVNLKVNQIANKIKYNINYIMKDWISPIPKIVHLIWIGNNPYPDYFLLFMKTFKKYLPEFEIRIWGNKSLNK